MRVSNRLVSSIYTLYVLTLSFLHLTLTASLLNVASNFQEVQHRFVGLDLQT